MDLIHRSCCGMDIHQKSIVACVRITDPHAPEPVQEEVRTFATTTREIMALGDWLEQQQVSIVAMESTGVYWKPVWNLLEGRLKQILINPREVKPRPGQKTDRRDARRIAELLSYGLLSASFVPERPQRELRDLTRTRATLLQDKARVANRLQKTLQDANIKLGSVASDVLGASGRDMIRALIDGAMSPEAMAQLARQRMRPKIPQLIEALRGHVNDHHRFMLQMQLDQIEQLEDQVEKLDARIEAVMSPLEKAALNQLDDIPGIDRRAAQNILAEVGADMSRFPTSGHLSSWAGLCPGNNQSAGRRGSGRMSQGNRWLKSTLNQCAWAASRARDSYFSAQHRRIAGRRGVKRATMAVAHTILCVCYELLSRGEAYQDLGHDYFVRRNETAQKSRHIRGLEAMGYRVTLEKLPAA
jgi:transposase